MASRSSNRFSQWWQQKGSPIFQNPQPPTEPNIKCLVYESGNTLNFHKDFMDRLKERIRLQEVFTEDACDFILVFCPVVSRAGTDIEAAMKKLQNISETKPAVLVVLHHTFDPERVVPDSSRAVNRKNMIAVDCLFHEDHGLLQCSKNDESLSTTIKYIKSQVKELYKYVRKRGEGVKSELRNGAKKIEDTNTKLAKIETSEAQESKNVQHEGDQQLNQKYTQEAQKLVEIMEKRLEERQNEIHKEKEELKYFKNFLELTEKTLSKKVAELVKANEKFQNATEQIKEKNTQLANMNKLLSEKETQLKNTDKELETSKNKLETLGQELQDKKRQLQEMMIVLEQQKTESAEKNKQLAEKESLLTERETQLMERDKQLQEKDRLLTENAQTLQMKDKTLEEKDILLREVKEELETTKQELMEKDKQLQEKDRRLAAQTLQTKEEMQEQNATQFKQEKEQEEDVANTGIGELPGPKRDLELESSSQEDKDQQVEELKRQIGNENTEQKNNENLTQEKGAPSKYTKTEIENMAKEPQERKRAAHDRDEQLELKDTQEAHIQVEEKEKNKVEKDKDLNKGNEHQKGQDKQQKAK